MKWKEEGRWKSGQLIHKISLLLQSHPIESLRCHLSSAQTKLMMS